MLHGIICLMYMYSLTHAQDYAGLINSHRWTHTSNPGHLTHYQSYRIAIVRCLWCFTVAICLWIIYKQ